MELKGCMLKACCDRLDIREMMIVESSDSNPVGVVGEEGCQRVPGSVLCLGAKEVDEVELNKETAGPKGVNMEVEVWKLMMW
jgi:hypothetical protein